MMLLTLCFLYHVFFHGRKNFEEDCNINDEQPNPMRSRQNLPIRDQSVSISDDYQNNSLNNKIISLYKEKSHFVTSNRKRSSSSLSAAYKHHMGSKNRTSSAHVKIERTRIGSLYHQITSNLKQGLCYYSTQGAPSNIVSSSNKFKSSRTYTRSFLPNYIKAETNNDVNGQTITAKIIALFNAGDIDEINSIITNRSIPMCEVYFSTLNHVLIGRNAFFSLWSAIFEAFPNGIFRPSPTIIDENHQYHTNFIFFGTKIFPMLIDGVPVELQNSSTQSEPIAITSGSIVIDSSRIFYSSIELEKTEEIPEMLFEGYIILQMSDDNKIIKFEFSWCRKNWLIEEYL